MNNNLEELFYPKVVYKKHPNTQEILKYANDVLGTQTAIGDIVGVSQKTVSEWMSKEGIISLDKEKIMPLIEHLYPRRASERHLFEVIDTIYLDVDKLEEEFEKMINDSIEKNLFDRYYFEIKNLNGYHNREKEFFIKNLNYKNLWKIKNYDFIFSFEEKKSNIENKYINLKDSLNNLNNEILESHKENLELEKEYNDKKEIYDREIEEVKSYKDWENTPESIQEKLLSEIKEVESVEYNNLNHQFNELQVLIENYNIKVNSELIDFENKLWKEQNKILINQIEKYLANIDVIETEEIKILNNELNSDIDKLEDEFNKKYYPDFEAMKKLNDKKFYFKKEFLFELSSLIPEKIRMLYYYKGNNSSFSHDESRWKTNKNYRDETLKKENLLEIKTKKVGIIGEKVYEIDVKLSRYEFFILNDNNKVVVSERKFEMINNQSIVDTNNKEELKSQEVVGYTKVKEEIDGLNKVVSSPKERIRRILQYTSAEGFDAESINVPIIYQLKEMEKLFIKLSKKQIPISRKVKSDEVKFDFSKIWKPLNINELINKLSELLPENDLEELKDVFFYAGYKIDDIEMLFL